MVRKLLLPYILFILTVVTGCSPALPSPTAVFPTATLVPSLTASQTPMPSLIPSNTATLEPTTSSTYTPTKTQTPTITQTPTPAIHICDPAVRYFEGHFFSNWPVDPTLPFLIDRKNGYGAMRPGLNYPHHGLDLTLSAGTPVLSVDDGIVVFAGQDNQEEIGGFLNYYGNLIIIQHQIAGFPDPVFSLYGHLSAINVQAGNQVTSGQIIGEVGNTGIATGSHLHFEVRYGEAEFSNTLNPELWLPPRSTQDTPHGTVAGYVINQEGHFVEIENLVLKHIPEDIYTPLTKTYISTILYSSLNQDPVWQESFTAMDLSAGQYQLEFYWNGWYELEFELKPDQITLIGFCIINE